MTKFISACGLDCNACECYIAHQTDNLEAKADIAIRWSKMYDAELTAKDIACDGCMSESEHFAWCGKCPIRACVVAKGFDSCAMCESFPCSTNEFLYNAAPGAKENIISLRG